MATYTDKITKETSKLSNCKQYYKSTKKNYLECLRYYLEGPDAIQTLWTRSKVREKIKEIIETKKMNEFTATATELDVAVINGEEVLIVTDTTKQVLPYEDYFDVFIDLHYRFGHMKQTEMFEILSSEYVIEEKVLGMFINSCNTCTKTASWVSRSCKESYNELVHIDILGMCHKPDNNFNYILIYIEVSTNFVLLRPLLNTDTNEVASELYKIFIDLGPPAAINATNLDLLNNVLQTLKMTPVKYDIPIYEEKTFHLLSNACIFELEKWLAYSSSSNWAFGCYIVQYILNTSGMDSAKNKVFGKKHDNNILNIPYLPQSNIEVNKDNVMSKENEHGLQSIEPHLTENTPNSSSISHKTELHVEEDLGIDYGFVETEKESNEDDIEKKLNYSIISNTVRNNPEVCSVCRKEGVSALVICSVCNHKVHLICGERFPVLEYESTNSKVVCSKC